MTVTGVFEFIHCNTIKGSCSIVDNLVTLLQRGRVLVDLTSSDQEQLVTWSLYIHKVVLEWERDVDCPFVNCFCFQIVFVYEFRVSLKNIDMACLGCTCRLEDSCVRWSNHTSFLLNCGSSGIFSSSNYSKIDVLNRMNVLPFSFCMLFSAWGSGTQWPLILCTLYSGKSQCLWHLSQLNLIVFISKYCMILFGCIILTLTKHWEHGIVFDNFSASDNACLLWANEIRHVSHALAWHSGHSKISPITFMQIGHSKYSVCIPRRESWKKSPRLTLYFCRD